jgi:hypothetical protein
MKYITIPNDITVIPPADIAESIARAGGSAAPDTVSFRRYAFSCWLNDQRAIDGGFTKQCRWAKVIDAFQAVTAGSVLPLEDEDYTTLRTIVDKPTMWLPPTTTVQLLAFSRAVLDASDKAPQAVVIDGQPTAN